MVRSENKTLREEKKGEDQREGRKVLIYTMVKIQPRAGFWPQLDKIWFGPRILRQHSLEGRCAVALGLCRGSNP